MKSILKLGFLSAFFLLAGCNADQLDSQDERALTETVDEKQKGCETAFAYSKGNCFSNDGFNRWGWVLGPLSEGAEESYDLYAGAGKCNIGNGTLVGSVTVSYNDGTVTVDYSTFPGFGLTETHLYVGNNKYPLKPNGQQTVAPGQYGNQNSFDEPASSDSYSVDGLEGDIYVIAHAVVCEVEEEVCEAFAGTLIPNKNECLEKNGEVTISATPVGDAVVPEGYEVIYVLTKFSILFIIDVNDTPSFVVDDTDEYRIHTLVYDPETLDLSGAIGTFAEDLAVLLIENGGDICASLDVKGASVKVIPCENDVN